MSATRDVESGLLRHALGATVRVDWTAVAPWPALRCALGVGVALVTGLLAGQPAAGMFGAIGAVSAGFASFEQSVRSRGVLMFWAAAAVAAALVLGSLAGQSGIAATLLAALAGLVAGLFVALGPAASFVALQAAIAALIAGAFAAPFSDALPRRSFATPRREGSRGRWERWPEPPSPRCSSRLSGRIRTASSHW